VQGFWQQRPRLRVGRERNSGAGPPPGTGAYSNRKQRFFSLPVEQQTKAILARLLATPGPVHLARENIIKQRLARNIVVPDIVVQRLVVPAPFARLGQSSATDRNAERVTQLALATVVVSARVTGRDEDQARALSA